MARPAWKRTIKTVLKFVLAGVVLWALGRHVLKTYRELSKHGDAFRLDPGWTFVSLLLYIAGLFALGVVFSKVMRSSPSPVGSWVAIRAYVISHLGKYVPGKAMVVILRVGLVVPHGASPATAGFATFYETFAMMAAGAILATLGFAVGAGSTQYVPLLVSAGLAAAFLFVTQPSVFPRLSKLATLPFPNVGPDALPRFSYRLLAAALLWSALGWLLLGFSQIALIQAVSSGRLPIGAWPVVIASVALATVAGFAVAILPAGLGIREGVLMTTLGPTIGDETAMIAALALRLVWVAAEVLVGGVLWVLKPARTAVTSPLLSDAEVS